MSSFKGSSFPDLEYLNFAVRSYISVESCGILTAMLISVHRKIFFRYSRPQPDVTCQTLPGGNNDVIFKLFPHRDSLERTTLEAGVSVPEF
jgi:hypothetical protein